MEGVLKKLATVVQAFALGNNFRPFDQLAHVAGRDLRVFGGKRSQHAPLLAVTETRSYIDTGSNSSSTLPRLSANDSRRTPPLSSSVGCRFAGGVGGGKRTCRPPRMRAAAPPATRVGRLSWSWTLGLPMPLP